MPTSFSTFNPGDLIEDTHIEQYIEPIQNLESGASHYRVATNTGNAYKVDFSSGVIVGEYTPGLIVNFKVPATNTGAATLTVIGPAGELQDIALVKDGDRPLDSGDILQDQVIAAIYTEDSGSTNPRFEVVGGLSGKQNTSERGAPLGYASLDATGKVPESQLPPASGGTPAWGGITGNIQDQTDLAQKLAAAANSNNDRMEVRVNPGTIYQTLTGMAITGQGGGYVARTPAFGTSKSKMNRIGFTGSGSTVAGWYTSSATGVYIFTGAFSLVYHFALSDPSLVTTARMFIGLSNSLSAATNVDPASLTQCIGIAQLATDSSQFYAVWGAGSGQSQGLGIGFDVNTSYRLEMSSTDSGSFDLTLTDLGSGSSSTISKTTGPVGSTNLYFRLWRTSNGSGSTSGIDSSNLCIERAFG